MSAYSKQMRLVPDQPPRGILKGFPLVPLASVVLLLLLTLMLTAAVEPSEPLVVLPPVAAAAQPAEPEPGTILVDKDGRLARDGSVVGLEVLGNAIAIEKRTDIRLHADRELSIGMLLTIRERLAAAGVRRLQLVVVRP
jgi:biopolymer transport protein ExbD